MYPESSLGIALRLLEKLLIVGVCLVLVLATVLPVDLPISSALSLSLPLIPVYFWAVHRPHLLPAFAAFLIGLLHDLIGNHPLGLNALILVLTQWVTMGPQRHFLAQGPMVAWYGFFLVASGAAVIHWLVGWFISSAPSPFPRVMGSYLVTAAIYPLFAFLLYRIHRLLLRLHGF